MHNDAFQCLCCFGSRFDLRLKHCPDYYLGLGVPVDYVECLSCGLVQQWPTPKNLDALYTNYPVHQPRTLTQRLARNLLQRQVYFRAVGDTSTMTLLDYGCGDGVYLREMAGHYAVLLGYEPGAAHAAHLARNLNLPVYSDPKQLAQEWAGKVNVITAHYVMEHVTDLHKAFALFQGVLKPGGLVHIAVPNIRSWEARWFGKKWHGLDAPRHISFPGREQVKVLASLYGFDLQRAGYAIFPNTLAASVVTALTGRFHPLWFNALILPSWLVAAMAPSGTEVMQLIKT